MKCDSCDAAVIDGVFCHETGCPNVEEAKSRGRAAGLARRAEVDDQNDLPDWSPLSGEWAGESIPELLGDLLPDGYEDEEIVDAYEDAALEAYAEDDRCQACRDADLPECDHQQEDNA